MFGHLLTTHSHESDYRRDSDDERQVLIDLTDLGQELRQQALAIPPAVVAKLGMEIPELEALHAALTRVIAAARDP